MAQIPESDDRGAFLFRTSAERAAPLDGRGTAPVRNYVCRANEAPAITRGLLRSSRSRLADKPEPPVRGKVNTTLKDSALIFAVALYALIKTRERGNASGRCYQGAPAARAGGRYGADIWTSTGLHVCEREDNTVHV